MSVVAKFYVSKLENPEGAAAAQVALNAVCRGVENALWAQATPAGSIQMNVKNDPAFDQFEYGAEYLVTFTKVAKPMPGDGHPVKPVTNMHGWDVCETCGAHLGPSAELLEKEPYRKAYEDKRPEALALHEETYGKAEE